MASDITPNGKAYTLSYPDETDNKVRSFYIKVKDCKGTFGYSVTAGLYVDLDKDAELAKEENNRIANDGHIINYGFMRMLYDNALQEYDYAGVSSPQYCNVTDVDTVTQIGNDDENYGNFVRREYAKCYLREVSVMMGSKTSWEPSRMEGSSNTGYNMDVITSGEIFNPDAAGELRKFALYSILPKEFNMSESLFSNSNFISGFAYDTSGLEVDNDAFESHVSDIEIKTLSDGRKVIYLEFDFSDRPLELSKRINVSVNYTTSIDAKVLDACTDQNFTIESRTAVLDNGYIVIRKNTTEAGDTNKWNEVRAEPAVTGNNDLLLAGSYHRDFLARNPSSWQNRAIKAAKRGDSIDYSRDFEVDTAEKIDINAYNENAGADNSNTVYTYEIGISLRDIRTEDIVLYDYIEGYSSTKTGGSVWHGVPLSVDTTKLCNKGFTTEVYYKIVPDGEDVNEDTVTDNSLTGWTLLNSADNKIWEFPDIAQGTKVAVAIKLNTDSFHDGYYEAPVDKNEYLFAYIKMRSPTPTQSSVDESAYNNCFVKWMPHDETKYNDIVSPSSTVTLRTEIFIIKQDEANTNITLPGAVFEIYADDMITLVTTVTTDRFGKAQINGLVYGERYYYKEVKAPAGYQLDNTMKELLYSYTASPIPVHVDNHAIAGRVTLQKVDKNNSSITIPEGAHYSFYSREGVLMELYTTNTPGYYSFDDIDSTSTTTTDLVTNNESKIVISDVPLGVYYFVETMAPDGYILDETPLYAVVDKALATGVETEYIEISVTHAEEERLFSAELTKVDAEDDSIKLADAWFNLLMLKPDTTDQWVICKEYLRTDMYGSLKVTDLVYGTYKFEEILPPEGYEMNQSPYSEEFTISPNDYGATDSEIVTQITMTNPRKKGSVMLNKVDMETKSLLIGAIMDLYKKGDTIENDVKIGSGNYRVDSTGRLVFYPLIDTMDKYIYTGLDWGEYYFHETTSPTGYKCPSQEECRELFAFTIDANATDVPIEVTAENEQTKGDIRVTKFALDVNGDRAQENGKDKTLPGAEFELRTGGNAVLLRQVTVDGNIVYVYEPKSDYFDSPDGEIELSEIMAEKHPGAAFTKGTASTTTAVTASDGTITVYSLPWGSYELCETKAPDGYSTADNIKLVVNSLTSGFIQEIECEDPLATCEITIKKQIDDRVESYGDPLFIFNVKKTDDILGKEWNVVITLENGAKSGSATIRVPAGEYEITETDVSRYGKQRVSVIKAETTTAIYTPVTPSTADFKATCTLTSANGNNDKFAVLYENTLSRYDLVSHVDIAENRIPTQLKVAGVQLEYTGLIPVGQEGSKFTLDKNNLIISVVYENNEVERYTLSSAPVDFALSVMPADGSTDFIVDNGPSFANQTFSLNADVSFKGRIYKTAFNVMVSALKLEELKEITFDAGDNGYFGTPGVRTKKAYFDRVGNFIWGEIPEGTPIDDEYLFVGWKNGDTTVTTDMISSLQDDTTLTAVYISMTTDFAYKEATYNGNEYHTYVVPISGWYSIELWGASGKEGSTFRDGTGKEDKYGDYEPSISQPGRGGYTKSDIYLEAGTTLYFYIGGQGKMGTGDPDHDGHVSVQNPELGGYNGGAGHDYSWDRVAGGGGATDVRIVAASKTWDEYSSLASRIMVAGGGASNFDMRYNDVCGNAGGLVGQPGRIMGMHYGSENIDFAINDVTTGHDWTTGIYNIGHNSNPGYPYGTIPQIYAEGGKQDGGGTIGNRAGMIIRYGGSSYMFGPDDNLRELGKESNHGKSFIDSRFNGTFGKGGIDCFRGLAVGGAGGGYYGGCAGSNIHVQCNVQSAGGSSFISGYDGCLAVDYAQTEENGFKTIVHKDNSVFDYNGTEYVFTNTYMGGYDPSIEYVPITEAVTYNKKITGTYTSNPKYEDPRDYRPPQVKDNPTTDGTGIEYGHYGNGHVKITLVNTGSKDNPPLS